jgi:hypothetical protein
MHSLVKKHCSTSDKGRVSLFFLLEDNGNWSIDFRCSRTISYLDCCSAVSSGREAMVAAGAGASNGSCRAVCFDLSTGPLLDCSKAAFLLADDSGSSFSVSLSCSRSTWMVVGVAAATDMARFSEWDDSGGDGESGDLKSPTRRNHGSIVSRPPRDIQIFGLLINRTLSLNSSDNIRFCISCPTLLYRNQLAP